jgi:hypothetical protein
MPKQKISRRDFLKLSFTAFWGAILAACKFPPEDDVEPTATPTSTPTDTPEPKPEADAAAPEPEVATETPTPTPEPCFSLLEPANKTELGNIGRVAFVWKKQKGANSYKLIIILPNELIEEYETDQRRFEKYLESLPMAGKYHWHVIAYNSTGEEICVSETFIFTKKSPSNKDRNGDGNNNDDGGDDEVFGDTH